MSISRIIGSAILGLILSISGSAQSHVTSAAIAGTVYDQSGAIMPGASITATRTETNTLRSTNTDSTGRYIIPALNPGTYTIAASMPGFRSLVREGIVLEIGQSVTLDLTLDVATIEESINVSVDFPIVETDKTVIANAVNQHQINTLPINGRNFISFSTITAGAANDLTLRRGATAASGLSFNGQRARSNSILVDGLDNNDDPTHGARATFSQEAIREFQVLTNSYSAEFGKASGGVLNILTKSGTNKFGGNAFLFLRDDKLNAKEYFQKFDTFGNTINRPKADFSQKQWGGTFGGPIAKDKAFFFLSFERSERDDSNFVTIDSSAAAVLEQNGFPVQLGSVPYTYTSNQVLGKIDYNWRTNQNLVIRANYSDISDENIEPYGGIIARSRGAVQLREDWSVSASQTSIFSKWLNEARIQLARQDQAINSLDPTCEGPCESDYEGGPTVEISGVALVGRERLTPQIRDNFRVQLTETISYFSGKHLFKAGMDFNYFSGTASLPFYFGARYIFAPLPAIPALGIANPLSPTQALALGLPAAYVQGYGNPYIDQNSGDFSFFVQDEWRMNANIVLKLGVRYQKQFWPDTVFDVNGLSESFLFPEDNNNIAPRLGIAIDPTGSGKTRLHAAYGIFYGNHITSLPAVTGLINGRDRVRTLVLQFPSSIAAWRAPDRQLPEPSLYPSLQFTIDPELKTPYAHHVSFGLDRSLGKNLSLAVSFTHLRGKNHVGTIDYNPIVQSLGPGRRPLDIGGIAGTSASVLQYTSFGESWYKGLFLSLKKRFTDNFQFLLSYTLSKAEDTSTDFQTEFIVENNGQGRSGPDDTGLPVGFDPNSEKGPAVNDQRQRFVFSGTYEMPWSFNVSTIVSIASGRPYNILAGSDLNGDGDGGTFPSDRARTNPDDPSTSVMRNSGRMPYGATLDLRVSRDFHLYESLNLQLILDAFNLFNRTNFAEINNIFGTSAYPSTPVTTFGQHTASASPRQLQLGLKLNF